MKLRINIDHIDPYDVDRMELSMPDPDTIRIIIKRKEYDAKVITRWMDIEKNELLKAIAILSVDFNKTKQAKVAEAVIEMEREIDMESYDE